MTARARALTALTIAGVVAALLVTGELAVRARGRLEGPAVRLAPVPLTRAGDRAWAGRSAVRRRGGLLEVHLRGTPEEIGQAQSLLLHDEMIETERVVWRLFEQNVPSALVRRLLLDVVPLRYRELDLDLAPERRRELQAGALSFTPDPFATRLPGYQRSVYLAALYDIALGHEESPLVGCTTFTLGPGATGGAPLLGRAFDFEVDELFDRGKAVFLVQEEGRIPFASVAWPGLVGVVSGMNAEGLTLVVHGARAGEVRTRGEPVVHELRRVLGAARDAGDALRALEATEPLVSHVVVVLDAAGSAWVIERVPGARDAARRLPERAVTTNHLEGPHRDDPRNLRVRDGTSTLARRARGEELLGALRATAGPADALALLRDRAAPGGAPLPAGDRRAIDAGIATHAIVAEPRARRLWVSAGPHLDGPLVAFELPSLFAGGVDAEDVVATLPPR